MAIFPPLGHGGSVWRLGNRTGALSIALQHLAGKSVRSVLVALLLLLLPPGVSVAAGAPDSPGSGRNGQLTEAQVLARLNEAMRLPAQISFRQTVDASGIFGRYHWSAVITREGGKSNVQASGLPSIVSKDLLADLNDFEKVMSGFDLQYKGEAVEGGNRFLLVDGVRKAGETSGAQDGRIWVDPDTFRIKKMEARYNWGRLKVENTYNTINGVTVLWNQEATLSPLPMRMSITYRDYLIGT